MVSNKKMKIIIIIIRSHFVDFECAVPLDPENGRGLVIGSGVDAKFKVICNSGYFLKGPAVRTCQTDGTWSHFTSITTCEGRLTGSLANQPFSARIPAG